MSCWDLRLFCQDGCRPRTEGLTSFLLPPAPCPPPGWRTAVSLRHRTGFLLGPWPRMSPPAVQVLPLPSSGDHGDGPQPGPLGFLLSPPPGTQWGRPGRVPSLIFLSLGCDSWGGALFLAPSLRSELAKGETRPGSGQRFPECSGPQGTASSSHSLLVSLALLNMLRASQIHHCVHKHFCKLGMFLRQKGRDKRKEIVKTASRRWDEPRCDYVLPSPLDCFAGTTFEQKHSFKGHSSPWITLIRRRWVGRRDVSHSGGREGQ